MECGRRAVNAALGVCGWLAAATTNRNGWGTDWRITWPNRIEMGGKLADESLERITVGSCMCQYTYAEVEITQCSSRAEKLWFHLWWWRKYDWLVGLLTLQEPTTWHVSFQEWRVLDKLPFYSSICHWNKLPTEIKQCKVKNSFIKKGNDPIIQQIDGWRIITLKWHFKYLFVNLILLRTIMLLYFNRAPFMLAHCLIDAICLPVFENIYILIIVLLCLFIYVFIFIFS